MELNNKKSPFSDETFNEMMKENLAGGSDSMIILNFTCPGPRPNPCGPTIPPAEEKISIAE